MQSTDAHITGQTTIDFFTRIATDAYTKALPWDQWHAPDQWKTSGYAKVMLTANIRDRDGSVAAARTLAALGGFDKPTSR